MTAFFFFLRHTDITSEKTNKQTKNPSIHLIRWGGKVNPRFWALTRAWGPWITSPNLCFSHSLYQIGTAKKVKTEQINPYRNLIPAPKLDSPEFHWRGGKVPFKSSGLKGSQYLSSDLDISSWGVKHPLKVSLTSSVEKGSLEDEKRKGPSPKWQETLK